MSGDENDFLTGMMAQAPAAVAASEADDSPESVASESGEIQASEPVAAAPVADPVAAPPAPPEEKTVPLAVLIATKDDYKRKLAARERELEELRSKAAQIPERTNFYDNPETHIDQRFQEYEARANGRIYAALESVEKETHPDFDEVASEVIAAAQHHPTLVDKIMRAANPAREMYKVGMKIREFQKMQDPDAYRANLEAEIRAKVIAELGGRAAQAQREAEAREAKANAIPPDISTRTNAPPKGGVTVTNPVNALFPRR